MPKGREGYSLFSPEVAAAERRTGRDRESERKREREEMSQAVCAEGLEAASVPWKQPWDMDDSEPCHVSLSLDPRQVRPGPNPDLSPHMHEALRPAAHSHESCNLGAVCGQRQGCRLMPGVSGCGVRKATKRILADASRPSKSPARPYGISGLEARFPAWPWPH